MISTIDDLDIDESPEAERGLSISERVTCILIAAEHAIEHAKRTPDVASLTSVVKRLLSMLVSAPFRPSHFHERVEAIAKGENRHAVIAGAIAELLAGDVAVIESDRYCRARKFIGVFETSLMVTSRELMPLAKLYDQMRSNPSVLVQEIVAIADRRLTGESLDQILGPPPQRPLPSDPRQNRQARAALKIQEPIRQTERQDRQQPTPDRIEHLELIRQTSIEWCERIKSAKLAKPDRRRTSKDDGSISGNHSSTSARMVRRVSPRQHRKEKRRELFIKIATDQPHLTNAEIAAIIGCHRDTVAEFRKELQLPRQRPMARGRSPHPKKPRAQKPIRDLRFAKAIRNGQLWLDGKRRRSITKDDQAYQLNQRDQDAVSRCLELLASHPVSVDELSFVPELLRWISLLHCRSQNEKPHRRNRQKWSDTLINSVANHSDAMPRALN